MSPLLGADGETYAIAQGNVVVGGLGVEGGDNSSLTVNIPTVGRIPRGASVERLVPTEFLSTDFVILNLHRGDFSTANNIANAIDDLLGAGTAIPLDTNSVRVRAPEDPTQKVAFVSILENIEVERSVPRRKDYRELAYRYFGDKWKCQGDTSRCIARNAICESKRGC